MLHKRNWLRVRFVEKAAAVKQQMSKFYPHFLSTEVSIYIYDRPLVT